MSRKMLFAVWACLVVSVIGEGVALGAEHAEPSSPSPFGGSAVTAIFTLIIFLLLLVVLSRFAWKPLLEALNKREDMIRNDIDGAHKQREDAEQMLKEYRQRLDGAQTDAEKLIKQSAAEAEAARSELLAQAQAQAREALQKVHTQMEQAKQQALRDVYEHSAELAAELAAKILRREVNSEDHRVLIRSATDELESQTNGN